MPDGKALQSATSHNLGQNFSKVFEIEFLDTENKKQNPWQTSWGLSTRSIGGLILVHGDNAGLVIPPRAAPIQVVVLTLPDKDETKQQQIVDYAQNIVDTLKKSGVSVKLDADNAQSLGNRANKWELKGVPVRLEVGLKEIEKGEVTWARRDTFAKSAMQVANLTTEIPAALEAMQSDLLAKSKQIKADLTKEASSYDEFKQAIVDKNFVRAFWCEEAECEKLIKQETKATTRCLELENVSMNEAAKCVRCDKPAHRKWLFAMSY
jgi:prolyl-tRNA synthetase